MRETKIAHAKDYFKSRGIKETPRFFTAPGRTELGGNHTDHNHGKVLAAAVQFEALAAVIPAMADRPLEVRIKSKGWEKEIVVNLDNLEPVAEEEGQTHALLRGVAAGLKARGYAVGGFHAYVESDVPVGSGLSSSAAFEVLIGEIHNHLFNGGKITPVEIAQIGQFAENKFFGKPCGLMDQTASACGGIITIDFQNPQAPVVQPLNFDLNTLPWTLMIVNTGGSHADLTPDYAAITTEMGDVAKHFGKKYLRDVDPKMFRDELPQLFRKYSHRALLRAVHFFEENTRVEKMVEALNKKDVNAYLEAVKESGRSSFQFLQNAYSPTNVHEQGVALALALTETFLAGEGACRIHGGGFAGTIQAYVPKQRADEYRVYMSRIFGLENVFELRIRNEEAGEL